MKIQVYDGNGTKPSKIRKDLHIPNIGIVTTNIVRMMSVIREKNAEEFVSTSFNDSEENIKKTIVDLVERTKNGKLNEVSFDRYEARDYLIGRFTQHMNKVIEHVDREDHKDYIRIAYHSLFGLLKKVKLPKKT